MIIPVLSIRAHVEPFLCRVLVKKPVVAVKILCKMPSARSRIDSPPLQGLDSEPTETRTSLLRNRVNQMINSPLPPQASPPLTSRLNRGVNISLRELWPGPRAGMPAARTTFNLRSKKKKKKSIITVSSLRRHLLTRADPRFRTPHTVSIHWQRRRYRLGGASLDVLMCFFEEHPSQLIHQAEKLVQL